MGIIATSPSDPYLNYSIPSGSNHIRAARAAVACLTLIAMFNKQKSIFPDKHQELLSMLPGGEPEIEIGLAWGKHVGMQILLDRSGDSSDALNDKYAPSAEPYRHRPDIMATPKQCFLGPLWGQLK